MKLNHYFTSSQIEQIREGAATILHKIGVKVPREDVLQKLKAKGLQVDGEYVKFEPKQVYAKMDSQRYVSEPPPKQSHYFTYASAYSNTYENIDGSYTAISNENNIKMGQFAQNAAKLWPGLQPNCPGHPQEIHADLQFLRHIVNSFIWCQDFNAMEPVTVGTAPYHMAICEAMGKPVTGLPVYAASPLTIAGESFDIVLANADKLESAWVNSMPSIGANTPLNLVAAYAQTVAETLGGALVIEAATGLKSGFSTNLFTFDFYAMTMPFGTPEKLLLEWTNNEVSARIGGGDSGYIYMTDIHTNALHCSIQAAAEKASLAMAGALAGSQGFNCSGTLGMDELFSPVQLLLDLEMLDHVQRIADGMPVEDFDGELIEEVKAGIKSGYLGADRTLDNMQDYNWRSRFYNRQSFGAHLRQPVKDEMEKATVLAQELMAAPPSWKLDDALEKELESIYAGAEKAVHG